MMEGDMQTAGTVKGKRLKHLTVTFQVLATVFLAEIGIKLIVETSGFHIHGLVASVLDGALLFLVVGPTVYWWIIKPHEEDREKAANQIKFSEQRFKDFALSSGDWFWEMGPDLRFTYVSERFAQVMGMSPDHFLGMTRQEVGAYNKNDPKWKKHIDTLKAHEPFKNFQYSAEREDGHKFYFSVSGVPCFDEYGVFIGYRGTASDVSSRVRAEEILNHEVKIRQEAEASLRKELDENRRLIAVIEASPIGVTISEMKGETASLIYSNKAVTELTGYGKEEIQGRDLFFILGEHTNPDVWNSLNNALEIEQRTTVEVLCYRKDGSTFWNSLTVFPIVDTRGNDKNIVTINADITERIEIQDEKEQMIMRALETSRIESLGTLAGGIAHEINTPIQYIGDNLVFLNGEAEKVFALLDCYEKLCITARQHPDLDQEAKTIDSLFTTLDLDLDFLRQEVPSAIAQSLSGVQKVANIVKAVKEFSHPGAKEMQNASINHLIESVAIITQNQWKYVADLEMDLDPQLPLIECNPDELNQVFVNLIINASQAIEEEGRVDPGTITIASRAEDDTVVITVADDGPGIPEADQERVFDLFFTSKPPGKGTGQGLAISHNIIINHNGQLTLSSTPGHGVTFTIVLPIQQAQTKASSSDVLDAGGVKR